MNRVCEVCKKEFFSKQKRETCGKTCQYTLVGARQNPQVEKFFKNIYKVVDFEIIRKKVEEEHYAPFMVWDMLKRDYSFVFEDYNISKKSFRKYLMKFVKFDSKKYNKQQNCWKLQYKYPKDWSAEDLLREQKRIAREGQKATIKIRKSKENFIPQYTLSYWLQKSDNDIIEAEKLLQNYKQSISPCCVSFYLRKGYSEEEAKNIISKHAAIRGLKGLKKTQKPQTEKIIKKFLKKNNISYSSQFKISLLEGEKLYRTLWYVYDFFVKDFNLIIECQGNYWHANPTFFSKDSLIKYPSQRKEISVQEIWELDKHKKGVAVARGFEYIAFWEDDIKNGKAERYLLEFLRN
jgi:hypothetical protein